MYFPYLRGRQNELLALIELVNNNLIGNEVIPILEPIKMNCTLVETVKAFIKRGKQIAVVLNPNVGVLNERILSKQEDMEFSSIAQEFYILLNNSAIIKSFILNNHVAALLVDDEHLANYLIINTSLDSYYVYDSLFKNTKPRFTLVPHNNRFSNIVEKGKVLLKDNFIKRNDTQDYKSECDTLFSKSIYFYKEEGFIGLSDYSIVGKDYIDTRYAPTSVAIHLTYFDGNNLRIHNFVSQSNKGIEDPAGELREALVKMIDFCEQKSVKHTKGLDELFNIYKDNKYPGLGTIKKLSIMHHIELVSGYLEEKKA